jgi:hypothetical protein
MELFLRIIERILGLLPYLLVMMKCMQSIKIGLSIRGEQTSNHEEPVFQKYFNYFGGFHGVKAHCTGNSRFPYVRLEEFWVD